MHRGLRGAREVAPYKCVRCRDVAQTKPSPAGKVPSAYEADEERGEMSLFAQNLVGVFP